METIRFNFENLNIWKKAIVFSKEVIALTDNLITERKHFRVIEQLVAASVSIPANIAEGTGRFSRKEFINFLYIARGSLYETVTLLTICHQNAWIQQADFKRLELQASEINRMISGLINSIKRS